MDANRDTSDEIGNYRDTSGEDDQVNRVYVKVNELPSYTQFNRQVQQVVDGSTWLEKYGLEWMTIFSTLPLNILGYSLMSSQSSWTSVFVGMFLVGCVHILLTNRMGHLAAHGALVESPNLNRFLCWFLVELCGTFSTQVGIDFHIKTHHPHTNIIGLGDSSAFKVPFAPRYVYMFIMPFAVPLATPIVALEALISRGDWKHLIQFLIVGIFGLSVNAYLFVCFSNFSWPGAWLAMFASRAALSIPFIHINVFQHVGLAMYDRNYRPQRVYQMSTSSLNIHSNSLLDYCFGPSLVNCHVEHHLFPRLSDSMCRKIQPIVRKFLTENNLPYLEDSYRNRVKMFLDRYEELMVKAPPITHFVGLQ